MAVERQQRGRHHHQFIIRADLLAYTLRFWNIWQVIGLGSSSLYLYRCLPLECTDASVSTDFRRRFGLLSFTFRSGTPSVLQIVLRHGLLPTTVRLGVTKFSPVGGT